MHTVGLAAGGQSSRIGEIFARLNPADGFKPRGIWYKAVSGFLRSGNIGKNQGFEKRSGIPLFSKTSDENKKPLFFMFG
jgi:hypothetical protein